MLAQSAKTLASMERQVTIRRFWLYTSICMMSLVMLLPVLVFFLNAFAFRWFYPQVLPQHWSLKAWERLRLFPRQEEAGFWEILTTLMASPVAEALGISLFIGIVVTLVSIILGLPMARALGLYQFRGKKLVEFIIVAPTIVPAIAFALGLNINFIRWGLAGTVFGVLLVHLVPVMPYVVLSLVGFFTNYNPDFESQARTLGATPIKTFIYVTFPAILPGIMVAGLFAFLVSWAQYILTFLIGGGRIVTLPILLFSTASGGNNSVTAAMSLIYIAPAIAILLINSRYLSGKNRLGSDAK